MQTLTIGKTARSAGVSIDTVRFYERAGLLPKPTRTPSGYRLYATGDVERLKFIRRAKALGFTLEDIGELLELSTLGDIKRVRQKAEEKLADVDNRIRELRRVRRGLKQLIERCPGHGSIDDCPIIAALSSRD